jgi:hypothetical protein
MQSTLTRMDRPAAVLFAGDGLKHLSSIYMIHLCVHVTGDFNAVPEGKLYEPLTYRAIKTHKAMYLRSVYNEDFPLQARFQYRESPDTYMAILRKGTTEETIQRCIGN